MWQYCGVSVKHIFVKWLNSFVPLYLPKRLNFCSCLKTYIRMFRVHCLEFVVSVVLGGGVRGHVCVCTCLHVCSSLWRPEVDIRCLLWSLFTIFIEEGSLTWTQSLPTGYSTSQLTPGIRCLHSWVWDYREAVKLLRLYVGAEDPAQALTLV